MSKIIVVGAAIVIALLTDITMAANADKEQAAVIAAEKWLTLVDDGNYAASWKEASPRLRASVTQKKWEQGLHSDREPEGKIISRKIKRSIYRSDPPDGKHVVIWYQTSFQNRKSAVERVWTRLDKDGQWRVTGYAITAGAPDLRSILMALLLLLIIISVWYMELKPKRGLPHDSSNPTRNI